MAAITSAIIAGATVLAAGATVANTVHTIKQDKKDRVQHESDMAEQRRVADEQLALEKQQQESLDRQIADEKARSLELTQKTEAQAEAERQKTLKEKGQIDNLAARDRQRLISKGAEGRSDTILTSPLGVTGGEKSKARKTLLGA
jgi:DNA anti-recombination protein RmuC